MEKTNLILVSCLSFLLTIGVATAEESSTQKEGLSLIEQGIGLLFRSLTDKLAENMEEMQPLVDEWGAQAGTLLRLMGEVRNYEAPEILPNGDILIRRKHPLPSPTDSETEIET